MRNANCAIAQVAQFAQLAKLANYFAHRPPLQIRYVKVINLVLMPTKYLTIRNSNFGAISIFSFHKACLGFQGQVQLWFIVCRFKMQQK